MKKITQKVSIVALCLVMIVLSVVPTFAYSSNNTYIENHSVIDCTNRYKTDDGKFNFTVKIPKGYKLVQIDIACTRNSEGDKAFMANLFNYSSRMTYLYSDQNNDYYQLLIEKFVDEGVGIKLYCYYNGGYYMATDNGNGQTTEGRGYWLSA